MAGRRYGRKPLVKFMKIVHVINGLEVGGAERMLARLALSICTNRPDTKQMVVSLSGPGALGAELTARGINVISINANSVLGIPRAVWHLMQLFRKERPEVVQSWLYRSDLVAGLAGRLAGRTRIAWGIRCTNVPSRSSASLKLLIRLNAWLSFILPHKIVCCAQSAKTFHKAIGFDDRRMTVISNGFDFVTFRPSESDRKNVRSAMALNDDDILVGIVGRNDQLKDFGNFIGAAALAHAANTRLKFVMIGNGLDAQNADIYTPIKASGLEQSFFLLGARDDVATLMTAMDIYCLSSCSEGFPNVVVEAMGAALPCVVTDVGDASLIVGDCGRVVPPRDAAMLSATMLNLAQLSQDQLHQLGVRARERAVSNYSLQTIAAKYMELYEDMDKVNT
jgi:glycosyltransferase involved in cell wall biosynthesis